MGSISWTLAIVIAAIAYCASLGGVLPTARFYRGKLNVAAAPDRQFDLWYKAAPYFSAQDHITSASVPSGGGDAPPVGTRPAWGAYVSLAVVAVLTMLIDVGCVNVGAAHLFSFTAVILSLASITATGCAYWKLYGPRFSLRALFVLIAVAATLLAMAFAR